VEELCKTIATAMTSPQTTTTEVTATMAATGINDDNPPNLNLTADMPPATETHAPTTQDQEGPETALMDGTKVIENIGEDAEKEQVHQDSARPEDAPIHDGLPRDFEVNNQEKQLEEEQIQQEPGRPEDAAIPQLNLNYNGLPDGLDLPDQAQIAGLDALIAMGQMGQYGYNPNLALAQAGALEMPMLPMPNQDNQWLDNYVPDVNPPEVRLVGYAKLVFEDGEFYMNTHSVILGRDPTAHRAAQRREKEEARRKMEGETPGPKTPVQIKREHMSRSVFSEKSGILREGNDSDPETREKRRQKRKASKKSKSTGSSHELSRRNSLAQQPPKHHVYEAQYPPRVKEENAVPVDPASLRPDPNECPIIPLHPPAKTPASAYKSISREHVKIAYNFNKAAFEMHIYGRNGAFVNDVYRPVNTVVELRSGDMLQVGQVPLEFVLPDGIINDGQVQFGDGHDDLAVDRHSAGGKEMSFDFEDDKRDGVPEASSLDPLSDDEVNDEDEEGEEEMIEEGEELELDEGDEGQQMSDHDQSGLMEEFGEEEVEVFGDEEQEAQTESIAPSGKKRGPGRPPKNGIMSAREEREQKAALKAALSNQKAQKSQKSVSQPTLESPPEKKKVGRPRKHEKPDPTEPEKPKRKYTKRKPKEPKDGETKEEGSDGEDQAAKEKKEKKSKPPRSPSPVFNEAELTPEQLQKPQANYVTLIYEALSNSKEGKLGLPQIYRAIQRKYPYFVLKVGTLGWQSSVRHNLSQHHAFEKVERDGKGWMWGIVKGVSIEKEKKRRTPPPPQMGGPMHHQPIYQAGQPPYMGYPHQQTMGHPGYVQHQIMHGPLQLQHYMGPPPHMNGQQPPPGSQYPPKPIGPGLAAAMIPQLAASGRKGYSSPYAPTAPPTAPPADSQRNEQSTPNEQQQTSVQVPPSQSPIQGNQPQSQPTQSQSPFVQHIQNQPAESQTASSQHIHTQPASGQHIQNLPPQSQAPQSQPQQGPPLSAAPQQPPPPATSTPIPELPQHNQQVIAATERFKESMLQRFKDPQGEEILNSAVNQVLGYTHESSLPGNKYEEGIIKHLRTLLAQIPGSTITSSNIPPSNPDRASTPQINGQQPSQPAINQNETQASTNSTPQPSKTSGGDKPTPTVMRPTFTGQGQSRPNVPRPPMGTPGLKRANSGSPAQIGESAQVVGQKRSLEEADDYKDVKRLNGAGMSPLKT
jgi:hypothetical protein